MKTIKNILTVVLTITFLSAQTWAQEPFRLKNTLVVAQQDDVSDRYSLEIALIQLFSEYGVRSKASLNVIKEGGSPTILLNDSIQNSLKEEGIDTYLLVSVRGYDNRFKPSTNINSLEDELNAGHLFPLFRENASRVTFTFTFYREGQPVHYELVRTGNVGSKEAVIRKLMNKVEKQLQKSWL